jgi:hypothetical protein
VDLGGASARAVIVAILEGDPRRRSLSRSGRAALEDLGGAFSRRCADPPCLLERGGGVPSSQTTA